MGCCFVVSISPSPLEEKFLRSHENPNHAVALPSLLLGTSLHTVALGCAPPLSVCLCVSVFASVCVRQSQTMLFFSPVEANPLYSEGPFVFFRSPSFIQEVVMLSTKPSNKSSHPEPLGGIIHSMARHFRGWHGRGRQQKPQGSDLVRT